MARSCLAPCLIILTNPLSYRSLKDKKEGGVGGKGTFSIYIEGKLAHSIALVNSSCLLNNLTYPLFMVSINERIKKELTKENLARKETNARVYALNK